MKKLITIFVLASILLLSSCQYLPFLADDAKQPENQKETDIHVGNHPNNRDFYPEGYTGGLNFHSLYDGPVVEYYWVETYEELSDGIEALKENGSTFDTMSNIIPAIETDDLPFDVKYVFFISGDQCRKYGEQGDFFDRKLENVTVLTYIFFDEVTIDELVFSNVIHYDCYTIITKTADAEYCGVDFSTETLRCEYYFTNSEYMALYSIYCADDLIAEIHSLNTEITEDMKISDEDINSIINSLVINKLN